MQNVDWTNGGTEYHEDVPALYDAIRAAGEVTDQPSLIVLDTIIAWPAPNAQGTEKAHGSALGADEVAATKEILGWDPDKTFEVPADVLERTRGLRQRGAAWGKEWDDRYDAWAAEHPDQAALLHRLKAKEMPDGLADALPTFDPDPKGMATRAASGKVINAIAGVVPELWGGSADLAGSNNTSMAGEASFLPASLAGSHDGSPYGRTIHFGVREHAMGSILNGIAVDGLTIPARIIGSVAAFPISGIDSTGGLVVDDNALQYRLLDQGLTPLTVVSIEHFGASAPGGRLFEEYGFTGENVAAVAGRALEARRA